MSKSSPPQKVRFEVRRGNVVVVPEKVQASPGDRLRFICEQANAVVVAQFNLEAQTSVDETPFANDVFVIKVPKGTTGKLVYLKAEEDLPTRQGKRGRRVKELVYEYAALAAPGGRIVSADPIIIIR